MDIVSFQMDLLRLGSAVSQQEQFADPVLPVLAGSLEQLADLGSADLESSELSALSVSGLER